MLIAHLPASYLLTRFLITQPSFDRIEKRWLMAAGLAAGLLPDVDMVYFYLIDLRQYHHHTYWTHLPAFWLSVAISSTVLLTGLRQHTLLKVQMVIVANILLHLILDTFVGDIWWLGPWIDRPYSLFDVPAAHGHWVWSFVLHWSFGLELFIVTAAAIMFLRDTRNTTCTTH